MGKGKPNPASATNGMLGGRPTELTDEILNRIEDYIEKYEPYYDTPITKTLPDGSTEEKMVQVANPLLSKLNIAKGLGLKKFSLYDWEDNKNPKSDRLSKILKRLPVVNEDALTQNSLAGLYDKTTSIFHLKQKKYGGFSDRQDINLDAQIKSQLIIQLPPVEQID